MDCFITRDLLVKYLLGGLSEAVREIIEREFFVNQEVWEALNEAETDLIDSYVRGSMAQRERVQFERHFLKSPQKRDRVELASLLLRANRKIR